MYVQFNIEKGTELEKEEWGFIVIDKRIILDSYYKSQRATKRHKFQDEKVYRRIGSRGWGELKAEQAPLPDEIKTEAMQKYIAMLEIVIDTK